DMKWRVDRNIGSITKTYKSSELGQIEDSVTMVFDYDHLSLRQVYSLQVISYLRALMGLYENHYPETLHRALIINGEVPSELYMVHSPGLWSEPGAKRCSLARGAVLTVPVVVERAGAVLDWRFQSKSHDLCFGLTLQNGGQSSSELLPARRVKCNQVPESGQLECQEPGT
ncbi:hypothetical protein IscW_ISCW011763, partial [Ixodes scapularis]